MKWSGPLPRLVRYTYHHPLVWALAVGISFPDAVGDFYSWHLTFGPFTLSLALTWPERSRL